MAAKDVEETNDNDHAEQAGPMLDMSQAAVKRMVSQAKARGYITYDELNKVLPSDQVSSEQIEDVMSLLSEMGVNVVEGDEVEGDAAAPVAELPAKGGGGRGRGRFRRRRRAGSHG